MRTQIRQTAPEKETEAQEFRRELLALAVPLSLQGLLNALVGASDALMLGRLTQDAIAAVSLANQISFVMNLFAGAVIAAVSVMIAQYWGKQQYAEVRRFLGLAIRYCIVISLLFFLATQLAPARLMRLFTPDQALIDIGASYLRIVGYSYLFQAVSQCFLMVMKIAGHARLSVWISAVTVTVDMSVDFFLIYGIGPVPKLGADGSAWSTIAVEAAAMIWSAAWSRRHAETTLQAADILAIRPRYEKDVWKILPGILAASLSWGLSIPTHSFILGHLNTDITAAASVMDVAQSLIKCIGQGIAEGSGIMIGALLGRSEFEKAKRYGHRFWKVSAWCGVINAVLVCIVGALVYVFYVLTPAAKHYLFQMILFSLLYMGIYPYSNVFTVGVFPAGGDSRYDAVSVAIATWCVSIPLALAGCFVFHWPPITVYIVMNLDEIIKLPFLPHRYRRYLWLRNLTHDDPGAEQGA